MSVSEIPRFKLLEKSFIDGALLDEGAEIEFSGIPGSRLEPLNDAARAAKNKGRECSKKSELPDNGVALVVDEELESLRQQYEELFGEKAHFNTKADTIREKIADKRKELCV
ncbi:TPA: hypothetical protein ACXZX0_000443 [Salmonella enterica]|uniref:hypothetical protein n=1 Tax=Salmonella enterica TaxID=28901 RepID=UPI0009A9B823|nr:hypothetical protein [Salmonella enterica]